MGRGNGGGGIHVNAEACRIQGLGVRSFDIQGKRLRVWRVDGLEL